MKTQSQAAWMLGLLALAASLSAEEPVTILGSTQAQARADATVRMTGGSVAVGVGYSWGRGVLNYGGSDTVFCMRGLSLGDVGAAHLKADGFVFNLHSLHDFSGKYFAMSAGAAVAGGESASLLKNDRGVTMQLDTKVQGIRFNLAAAGVRITVAGSHGCSK
jgi:hypothetical protein